jgi:Helix-turn-helix domain
MPQRQPVDPALAAIFHALSDPTRLAVVQRLGIAPASASELARPFAIVTSHKRGRTRTYQLAPDSLQLASAWLAEYRNHWERKLDQLDHLLITTNHSKGST